MAKKSTFRVRGKLVTVIDGVMCHHKEVVPNFDRRAKREMMRETGMSSRQFKRFRRDMKRQGKW